MTAFFNKPLSVLTAKYRIFHEESVDLNPRDEKTDHEELRGVKDSRIYRHGQDRLAISSDNRRLQLKLRDMLGIPREATPAPTSKHIRNPSPDANPTHLPRAFTGSVLLFPDELLEPVAEAIGAKKKRVLSPERLEELRRRGRQLQESNKAQARTHQTSPRTDDLPSRGQLTGKRLPEP